METSFSLFRIRGIDLRVHITFPLIFIWAAIQFGLLTGRGIAGAVFGIIVTLLLFVIVVLHEMGHSLAAQHYKIQVRRIVLLPIGGVAELAHLPEEPIQEFIIAIAGPLVNFGLALMMLLISLFGIAGGRPENLLQVLSDPRTNAMASIYNYVFVSNLFLGLFNLLPAFPMDGGRVLRALLASQMSFIRATMIAVAIGQLMAFLLGLWGFLGGGFFLILIAIFIYMGAGQEGQAVQFRSALGNLTVNQAYSRQAQSLSPGDTLQDAVRLTLSSFQADFPVCDADNFVGLLTHSRLIEALQRYGPSVLVSSVMLTDIQPVSPSERLVDVQQRMNESSLDALPVTDGGRFLGLLTTRDINELYRLAVKRPELIPGENSSAHLSDHSDANRPGQGRASG